MDERKRKNTYRSLQSEWRDEIACVERSGSTVCLRLFYNRVTSIIGCERNTRSALMVSNVSLEFNLLLFVSNS